ncbi:MAG: DUF1152 domain-containing protein [Solirubrobacterales bacterium]|nr:DUF1152 domain-containing protein [Solirubrobacterales bacterium]MBV9714755.1 DUF1152 domain-containing protein [Solirubrobacterales bacterium]
MGDAEAILRGARRPLVIGMGGGGDVVGALATAELSRLYDGADPVLGGITWERRPIDPVPGARSVHEIEGACELAPGVLLAGPQTRVRGRDVLFAESWMAAFLDRPTVLIDINGGAGAVADGLAQAARGLECDLIVFIDVGGDVLAEGPEPGLTSPLCDAIMLAAAARLCAAGHSVLAGIFGIGCDAELTPAEVLARIAAVAGAGGFAGARGLTEAAARRLEDAIALVPTEASAQAVRAFRGASGNTPIRDGSRIVELSATAAVTFYLDVEATVRAAGRLAGAVDGARDLEAANQALNHLGLFTELDREREAAR